VAFIVIDISAFLPREEFKRLVGEMRNYIKSSPPASGHDEVMLPGEPDVRTRNRRMREGIPIDETTWQQICETAKSLNVEIPTAKELLAGLP
jgi:LDH2 family malate/lactate/ureidoglycolate dehydrogenase